MKMFLQCDLIFSSPYFSRYFEEMDAVLGDRPSIVPKFLLDTSTARDMDEDDDSYSDDDLIIPTPDSPSPPPSPLLYQGLSPVRSRSPSIGNTK